MGALFDTAAFYVSNPSTSETAYTAASGDSLVNRFFQAPATATLVTFDRSGVTAGIYRVRSPLMYDNVKGIHIAEAAGKTIFNLQAPNVQSMYSQDTLIVEGTGGGAEYEVVTMTRYYSNFQGSDMRLASWGTIMPMIVALYQIEVATTSASTPTAWTDTVVTTTESLLKANTDHAVLGYTVDTAISGVAIKGADTSNFRYGGPGLTLSPFTSNYFIRIGELTGLPSIPIINSANVGNTFVSTIDAGSSTSSNVTLMIAQLARNLS
jgi:hypothetical protein